MKILVTAGPTREPIDPVRFISNRSSGKMGYALARSSVRNGHDVVLVSGPVALPPPEGVEIVRVATAGEMFGAVRERIEWCDALIMAAAVADWRTASIAPDKIKKRAGKIVLQLEPTPDILQSVSSMKGDRIFVGFAAETENLVEEARRKLAQKRLDLVVANDVLEPGSGFDVDSNKVTLIASDGTLDALPLMSKNEVADRIVEWVERKRGPLNRG